MEARIYITPKFSDGVDAPEVEVTDEIIKDATITQKADRNQWNFGLVSAGTLTLRLADRRRRFTPSIYPSSIFAPAGVNDAKVRVTYPSSRGGGDPVTVWKGLATNKEAKHDPVKGESQLLARTVDAVVRDAVVPGGLVREDMTIHEVLAAVFNVRKVGERIRGGLRDVLRDPANDLVVRDVSEIIEDDRQALKPLEHVLQVADGVASFDFENDRALVFSRGFLSDHADYPALPLKDIISVLNLEDGASQLFNEFVFSTGLDGDDEKVTVSSEASIALHGLHSADIDAEWVKNRGVCAAVGDYLLRKLSQPRAVVTLRCHAWALPPETMIVGREVDLDARDTGALDAARYGGDAGFYSHLRFPAIQGRFWIERIQRKIKTDTVDLTLREVKTGDG